jgi:hypothetical protein
MCSRLAVCEQVRKPIGESPGFQEGDGRRLANTRLAFTIWLFMEIQAGRSVISYMRLRYRPIVKI